MLDREEIQNGNLLAESILELGSIMVDRKLTMEEALKHFKEINPKNVVLYHETEYKRPCKCRPRKHY